MMRMRRCAWHDAHGVVAHPAQELAMAFAEEEVCLLHNMRFDARAGAAVTMGIPARGHLCFCLFYEFNGQHAAGDAHQAHTDGK